MEILDKDLIKDFLDDIVWSYSNLKTFKTCKREWYRTYILGQEECPNFYAQYGTLAHLTLEKYSKGELELFDIEPFLEYNWSSIITAESPLNKYKEPISDEYYNQLFDFFDKFDGFKDETVGSEIEFYTTIPTIYGRKKFRGFIDRLSIDNGEYIVTDYKSKGKFYSKKELQEYSKQLYFYSKYVYDTYGKLPKELKFLLFRTGDEVVIPFSKIDYYKTILELEKTLEMVYNEVEFGCSYNYFYCKELCGFRYDCTLD